jgi:hypothetical protein
MPEGDEEYGECDARRMKLHPNDHEKLLSWINHYEQHQRRLTMLVEKNGPAIFLVEEFQMMSDCSQGLAILIRATMTTVADRIIPKWQEEHPGEDPMNIPCPELLDEMTDLPSFDKAVEESEKRDNFPWN